MDKENSLVSVIIPAYNRRDSLGRCIDSVMSQTYRNIEIIIVDDCSTDGTMDYIVEKYGDITDVNIIYVRNDCNLGAGASRNVGVSYANGEYIAFQDSDDEWYADKLEKQMARFRKCGHRVGAVYSLFYTNGEGSDVYPPKAVELMYKSGRVFYTLLIDALAGMITLVMRKSVFLEIGGFNEQLKSLEDYEMTIRLARKYEIELVDEVLAVAHESENSVGKRNQDKIITQCYIMNLYSRELTESGLKRKKFEVVYGEACKYGYEEFFCKCLVQFCKDADYSAYAQEKWSRLYPSSRPEQPVTPNITGISACTGCMACLNRCPVGAISQGYDQEGFLIPMIDSGKCIQCGQCKEVCPVCNETQGTILPDDCYAVRSKDEIRRQSSSGGVFRLLAERVIYEGGYVSGAVWTDGWQVRHIVSCKMQDVERMMSSKYVQSNIGETFRRIRELLEQKRKVLFTGCACQIAGLKRYLRKEYDNLITADVVCHGVPSQRLWDSCLADRNRNEVIEVSFRKKEAMGWRTGLYLRYQDGTEVIEDAQEPYLACFLNSWTLRKSCYTCQFKNKKYSDITLGDFWGINEIYEFDDGLGTSFVTLNTGKGARFFKSILGEFEKVIGLPTAAAERYNPCIVQAVEEPKSRELFFREWTGREKPAFSSVYEAVRKAIRFDIALVYMWAPNYGNALTNYALYDYLAQQGRRVMALDNACALKPVKQFKEFARRHYVLSSDYFPNCDDSVLNECCEAFVVGSDQNWNYAYEPAFGYGNYFQLDFVEDNKKKVSYGASFGEQDMAMPAEMGRVLYARFGAVSVREDFGTALCRELYGVEAVRVLDPVFLLDKEQYAALTDEITMKDDESPYILAYILNPTEEKRRICTQIQERLNGIKIINIIDANPEKMDYNMKMLEYDHIKLDMTVEEWLSYMRGASFVVTDSYHGTCFSLIFEKNFAAVKNREAARFDTFTLFDGLEGRIFENDAAYDVEALVQDIDYQKVKEKLSVEIEKSKAFIRDNIL